MRKRTSKHKIRELQKGLSRYDLIMRGSVVRRYHKCGKKNCACHKDPGRLHGPYYYYTRKEKGKTVGKVCSAAEAGIITPYLSHYIAVTGIIRKISEISEQTVFNKITAERKGKYHAGTRQGDRR